MIKKSLILLLVLFISFHVHATHNRAGEITYEHISEYTYKITLITYTYTPSTANESRDSLEIKWGDDTKKEIPRILIQYLPDDIQKNTYVGYHTYPGPGVYEIVMSDPNRNDNIVNIPNSVQIVFTLKTTLKIDPLLGFNTTPVLLNPPIDKAAKGRIFIHNPSAYDADGDSLSYKIASCYGDEGLEIKNYQLPLASNEIYVNPVTGNLVWDSPVKIGEYNIAMEIEEWRNGIKIGSIVRDMQIEVYDTDSHPPKIENLPDYCITAGDTLSFSVTATDQDNDYITLSASGGALKVIKNPAKFPERTAKGTVTSQFTWNTDCSNVQKQSYDILFRAEDSNPKVQLTDYEDVKIKVVAPAPKNLTATAYDNTIELNWEQTICTNALGYKIYRKKGSYDFTPENCITGIPESSGYELIATTSGTDTVTFIDNGTGFGLTQGYTYCYRLISYFGDGSESYSSEEVCVELKRTVPIFTEATVNYTDTENGSVKISWLQPTDFDTAKYAGPYKYILESANELYPSDYSNPIEISGINNTTYTDTLINTYEFPKAYKLTFFSGNEQIGEPAYTTSVFLSAKQADKSLNIKFNNNTAWTNYKYTVFMKDADEDCNPNTEKYDSIASTSDNFFIVSELDNDKYYWFKVKSYGEYQLDFIQKPLINYSQEFCASPNDTVLPCPPKLEVESLCKELNNELRWSVPDSCKEDIAEYLIYYSDSQNGKLELLISLPNDVNVYNHYPETTLAGCYVISSKDYSGNSTAPEKLLKICIDNCTNYELPNVFTPDGNGINDKFIPLPYKFVEKIDLKIYNRWGTLVFETTDPDINWEGTDYKTGKKVTNGIYYYICDVYEKRLSGTEVRNITGFVHIYGNKTSKINN